MKRFQLQGKIYEVSSLEEITLRDMLVFERETLALMGRAISWTEVQEIVDRMGKLPSDEARAEDPGAMFLLAVTIWLTRRSAGDQVTLEEAISFPVSEMKPLPDTEDHQVATRPNSRARTASGQARKSRGGGKASTTTKPSLQAISSEAS